MDDGKPGVIELQIVHSKKNANEEQQNVEIEEIADTNKLGEEVKLELLKALGIINDW